MERRAGAHDRGLPKRDAAAGSLSERGEHGLAGVYDPQYRAVFGEGVEEREEYYYSHVWSHRSTFDPPFPYF